MVNMGELFTNPRLRNAPMDRVPLSESESERFLLKAGDLLFARQSLVLEGAGKCSVFLEDDDPVTFESHVTRVRLDPRNADPSFYFYYFQSHHGRAAIRSIVEQGAGASGIRGSELWSLSIQWRPVSEQRAIAHILGTLDDKIELNRRMNETLEAMARALFKSWFVDFDPVRAKAEGRDPGLPEQIADLFPDRLVDSELGEIPEGWEVETLGSIVDVIDCLHSRKPERRRMGLPLLQLSNIRDDGLLDMKDSYLIDKIDYERWVSRMEASPGDCVITNVGRVGAVAQVPSNQSAALGRNMTGIRCKEQFPFPTFLIECLISQAMKSEIALKMDTGTILDALNVRNIPKLRFVLPRTPVITGHYERVTRPLRAAMEENLSASRTLAALRDTLLPKLISGELRVNDATKIIAEATP